MWGLCRSFDESSRDYLLRTKVQTVVDWIEMNLSRTDICAVSDICLGCSLYTRCVYGTRGISTLLYLPVPLTAETGGTGVWRESVSAPEHRKCRHSTKRDARPLFVNPTLARGYWGLAGKCRLPCPEHRMGEAGDPQEIGCNLLESQVRGGCVLRETRLKRSR